LKHQHYLEEIRKTNLRNRRQEPDTVPFVSVIVPSLNSEETLRKCLTSIFQQTYVKERYEVILIDGGSIDKTLEIAKEFPVRIVLELGDGRGNAYNRGIEESGGKVIAFLDSDAYAVDSWLEIMVDELEEDGGVAAVHCKLKAPEECGFVQKCIDTLNFKGVGHANGVVYDKRVVVEEGGFDLRLNYLQEDMLRHKIRKSGYKVGILDKVLVYHLPRKDLGGFLKQNIEAGENEVLLYHLTEDRKILLEVFSRSLAAFAPLLLLFWPAYGFPAILTLALGYTIYISSRTHRRYRKTKYLMMVPLIAYISLIGSLIGYLGAIAMKVKCGLNSLQKSSFAVSTPRR